MKAPFKWSLCYFWVIAGVQPDVVKVIFQFKGLNKPFS